MDAKCCSQCCCVLSASGVAFLILIGCMLKSEPLYIQDIEDTDKAADNCFAAAGIYAGFVIATSLYLVKIGSKSSRPTGSEAEAATLKERRMGNYGSSPQVHRGTMS